jgi:hypothetical protein
MCKVAIQTDDGIVEREGIVDIAEVGKGRLRVALEDGETGMTSGTLFGAWGRWKVWVERNNGAVGSCVADRPLTMPDGSVSFVDDGRKVKTDGRYKRLKRADL